MTIIGLADEQVVHGQGHLHASANIGRYLALVRSLKHPHQRLQDHTARAAAIVLLAPLTVGGPPGPVGVVIVVERTAQA